MSARHVVPVLIGLLWTGSAGAQPFPPGTLDRLDSLEKALSTVTAQNEKLQFRVDQLERQLTDLHKKNEAPPLPGVKTQPPVAVDPNALSASGAELYNDAFNKLKQQDYGAAEAGFSRFLKENPKDPLAGNAQYWLGETHYVRSDFTKAVEAFLTGYRTYPKNSKAPDNLLKLGLSLSALSSKNDACKAFKRLGKEYPDAASALLERAAAEMTKLGC